MLISVKNAFTMGKKGVLAPIAAADGSELSSRAPGEQTRHHVIREEAESTQSTQSTAEIRRPCGAAERHVRPRRSRS